ncbi:MAG: DUF7305 domain-containing protein [Terriglobia bacterium]
MKNSEAAALRRHRYSQTMALWRGKPADTWPNRGVALILAMLVILVLSVLAASIIFVTQSQVWTSFNYRLTTQCRYAAEGGVQATMDWLQTPASYPPPVYVSPATPYPGFDVTAYPVNCTDPSCRAVGKPVVLSGDTTVNNYPDPLGTGLIQKSYQANLFGRPVNPIANTSFSTTATLMAMTPLQGAFPGMTTTAIQIWKITSTGAYQGAVRNAQEQLVVTYQKMVVSATANALFGTGNGCTNPNTAITLAGGSVTDSYNSSLPGAPPQGLLASGGNVGTNGGLVDNGGATINGNFSYSPTDPCSPPISGGGTLNGSQITMPLQINYPTPPTPPVPLPATNQKVDNKGCDTGGLSTAGSGCTNVVAGTNETLASPNPPAGPVGGPAEYSNLAFSNPGNTVVLTGGTYNVNTLSLGSGVTLKIAGCPVILNVAGNGIPPSQAVLDMSSGSLANSFPPSCFQIVYGGAGIIKMAGNAQGAGVVYAPNASIVFVSGTTWNGAAIGNNIKGTGAFTINYDRALGSGFYIAGNYVPMGFNWSSF